MGEETWRARLVVVFSILKETCQPSRRRMRILASYCLFSFCFLPSFHRIITNTAQGNRLLPLLFSFPDGPLSLSLSITIVLPLLPPLSSPQTSHVADTINSIVWKRQSEERIRYLANVVLVPRFDFARIFEEDARSRWKKREDLESVPFEFWIMKGVEKMVSVHR